jgi:hypothetical protein
VQRVIDVEPAMSAGEETNQGFYEDHEKIVKGAIKQAVQPLEHAADVGLADAEPASCPGPGGSLASCHHGSRSSCDERTARTEPMRSADPEFRTTVTVGELTVTGALPGTPRPPGWAQLPLASVGIGGDVQHLSCDEALELVDALLLVVLRIDGVAEKRNSPRANRARED